MKVNVPGKLFIAGEYSIMTKDSHAILVAVTKFLTVTINESQSYAFQSEKGFFRWIMDEKVPVLDYSELKHAKGAMFIAHKYLKQLNINPKVYKIEVQSELEENGIKYGLGSSAAIMVGIIKAILDFHSIKYTNETIFKLAVLAQMELEEISSGADLATCIYTGWIYYRKYDLAWLYQKNRMSLEIIDETWPGLEIKKLDVINYDILVGWTKKPSSSQKAITLLDEKDIRSENYEIFLKKANSIVSSIKENLLEPNRCFELDENIVKYQKLLEELEKWANIPIMTQGLDELIKSANKIGVKAKVSGSGNGDCGIALMSKDQENKRKEIYEVWKENGIIPLDITVWSDDCETK